MKQIIFSILLVNQVLLVLGLETFTPEIGKTYTISADVAGNGYILGDWFRYEGNDSSTLNRVDLTDNWQKNIKYNSC